MAQPSRFSYYAARLGPFVLLTACTSPALNTISLRKDRAADRKLHEVQIRFLRDVLNESQEGFAGPSNASSRGLISSERGVAASGIGQAQGKGAEERQTEKDLKTAHLARSISLDPLSLSLPALPDPTQLASSHDLTWTQIIFGEKGIGAVREGLGEAAKKVKAGVMGGWSGRSAEGERDAALEEQEQQEWDREISGKLAPSNLAASVKPEVAGAEEKGASPAQPQPWGAERAERARQEQKVGSARSLQRPLSTEEEQDTRKRTFY